MKVFILALSSASLLLCRTQVFHCLKSHWLLRSLIGLSLSSGARESFTHSELASLRPLWSQSSCHQHPRMHWLAFCCTAKAGSSHSAGDQALTPRSSGSRIQESRVMSIVCPDQQLEFFSTGKPPGVGRSVQLCRPVALSHSQPAEFLHPGSAFSRGVKVPSSTL